MTLILKNTFFDIEEPGEKVQARRSSSVPPTWKPLDTCNALLSDISTADSDDEVSFASPASFGDGDGHNSDDLSPTAVYSIEGSEFTNDGTESVVSDEQPPSSSKVTLSLDTTVTSTVGDAESESLASEPHAPVNGKFKLCLDDTVTSTIGVPDGGPKTKLSSKARSFAPTAAAVSAEILMLVATLREMLQSSPDVLSVKVSDGIMGGSTTVVAEVRSSCSYSGADTIFQMLCFLKSALLNAAAESETAYVLGYEAQPFQDINCGFQATVGCVDALQEHSVCWETFEQGFCPRRSTCRWCHPLPADLMQIVVMLKESA